MISVVKDSLDLHISAGSTCILKFKGVRHAHVAFKPNRYFWGIWERNRSRLKERKLVVEKDQGVYTVQMPISWYKHQLTPKGFEKFKSVS